MGMRNTTCKVLCKQQLSVEQKEKFRSMIDDEYLVNWIVDNLPAATRYIRRADGGEFMYMNGFPVGIERNGRYYIHNHVKLDLKYHSSPYEYEGYRIVGFEVEPHSMTQATRNDVGDVFRKPAHSKLLAVAVGSGVQIFGMSVVTLIFALFGFLSPAHRGALLQSMMLLFTFMGILAGYTSARLYKVFNGDDWKMATLLTAFLYPGIVFVIFFVLNLLIWGQKSSGAVPFSTMFALLILWFGISVPLVFLGSYFGFRKDAIELPVRTNPVPRQIPAQPWFIQPVFTALVGGVLPFGAVFTELFFIMSSLWQHQFYYLFGFLALVLIILVITCAEISIALTYFQLTSEDHHWWWRSFLSSAASAFYVFFYSAIYFTSRLQIEKVVSTILYFGYMALISILFFLLTGSIGCLASFA